MEGIPEADRRHTLRGCTTRAASSLSGQKRNMFRKWLHHARAGGLISDLKSFCVPRVAPRARGRIASRRESGVSRRSRQFARRGGCSGAGSKTVLAVMLASHRPLKGGAARSGEHRDYSLAAVAVAAVEPVSNADSSASGIKDQARPGGRRLDTTRLSARLPQQCCRASQAGQSRIPLSARTPLLCPGPRRCIRLLRRQWCRCRPRRFELRQDTPQHADSRAERVAVVGDRAL